MDDEEYEPMSRRFRPLDAVVIALSLAHGIAQAIARDLELTTRLVAAHTNYKIEREMFLEEAALELETLTGDEDE